jgi:hypothetical protein
MGRGACLTYFPCKFKKKKKKKKKKNKKRSGRRRKKREKSLAPSRGVSGQWERGSGGEK